MKSVWIRVSKDHPCPVCNRQDWDTFTDDGKIACCMRVKSDKPAKNGGWIHKLTEKIPVYIPPKKPVFCSPVDFYGLLKAWKAQTHPLRLKVHALDLGVNPVALVSMGAVWANEHQAWAFPMKDSSGKVVGIRFRNEKAEKWALKGSKQGLFYAGLSNKQVFITEGPTDTASALTLGLFAIGRPSCIGCEDMVNETIARNRIREAVIVADHDAPGIRGAERLQDRLKVPSVIWIPPTKDLREFVNRGGTKQPVESCIKGSVWTQPK